MLVQRPASVSGGYISCDHAYFSSCFDAYARPEKSAGEPTARVKAVPEEESAGLSTVADCEGFANGVPQIKSEFARPDDILVLPWNLQDKISWRLAYVQPWDAAGSPGPRVADRLNWSVNCEGRPVLRWPRDADARWRHQRA